MLAFLADEASDEARQLLRKATRSPWQPLAVLVASGVPTALFAWIYLCGFSMLRFYHPWWAALMALYPGLASSAVATVETRRHLREGLAVRGPFAVALSCWLAFFTALVLSDQNYKWHNYNYYAYQDLADYTNIDPSMDKGQSYMDSGQVYFNDASRIGIDQTTTFRSDGTYCVAPILSQPIDKQENGAMDNNLTVDFWAVGINCCDQERQTFTCGDAGDPKARAGIRLLRDDVRPFYALAVQKWNARNCPLDENTDAGMAEASPLICPIARHPLFFHWVVDPLAEVDRFHEIAMSKYVQHVGMFAAGNFLLVLAVLWLLFNLGFK